MQANSDALFEAALKLSDDDRLLLISRLLESVPAEDAGLSVYDPQFHEELDRRAADKEGKIAWSDLRAEGSGK